MLIPRVLAAAAAGVLIGASTGTAHARPWGFHIVGTNLVEPDGATFIPRGTNYMHAWWKSHTEKALADIKSLGANTVRIALSDDHSEQSSDVGEVVGLVNLCKANRLVCILDDHETFDDQWTLDDAANFWIGVKDALQGQEGYVLVNVGNEPKPMDRNGTDWATATNAAIAKIRSAGIHNTLVIDAPHGQDAQFVMRDGAPGVMAADPDQNLIFSIHMYQYFDTAEKVSAYLDSFQLRGIPLMIGEFGYDTSTGHPDTDAVMKQAVERGIGYLGWSWNGNKYGESPFLDQVNEFDAGQLTAWGQRLFFGNDGVKQTAVPAQVFGP